MKFCGFTSPVFSDRFFMNMRNQGRVAVGSVSTPITAMRPPGRVIMAACVIRSARPTASIVASAPRPSVALEHALAQVLRLEFTVVAAELARALEPAVVEVHRDHARGAAQDRAHLRERADRAAAEHDHRVAGADLGQLRAHVAGGQDVGQEERLLVGDVASGT